MKWEFGFYCNRYLIISGALRMIQIELCILIYFDRLNNECILPSLQNLLLHFMSIIEDIFVIIALYFQMMQTV